MDTNWADHITDSEEESEEEEELSQQDVAQPPAKGTSLAVPAPPKSAWKTENNIGLPQENTTKVNRITISNNNVQNSDTIGSNGNIAVQNRRGVNVANVGRRNQNQTDAQLDVDRYKQETNLSSQRDYDRRGHDRRDYDRRDGGPRDYDRRDYGRRDYDRRDYDRRDYDRRDYDRRD